MIMGKEEQAVQEKSTERKAAIGAPLVAACGILIAACMTFGNPSLWITEEQSRNSQGAVIENTDPKPDNTPQDIAEEGSVLLAENKASSQSDDSSRVHNIALAAETVNGIEVQPGEVFSFNEVAGDTENNDQYEVAPVVFGSDIEYARGGGICQVSTALYIAALEADMEIVERHPHSMVVDYAPIGLDATLVYGTMDLRLKNTSDEPIRFVVVAEGQTVTAKVYGKALTDGLTITASSKIIERRDAEGNKQEVDEGHTPSEDSYYVVESYRLYYQNGTKSNTQYLGTDTYEASSSSTIMLSQGSFDPTK